MAGGSFVGSIAKFILLLINLHFILVSLGLILFGSRVHLSKEINDVALDVGEASISWSAIATGCIVLGAILGMVSFFGFIAALCESAFLLYAYAYFLLSVALLVGSLYVYLAVIFNTEGIQHLRKYYGSLMESYYKNDNALLIVDNIQTAFFCCGDQSPEDWHNSNHTSGNNHSSAAVSETPTTVNPSSEFEFPKSCCKLPGESDHKCLASDIVYTSGCFSSVQVARYEYFFHGYFIATIAAILLLLTISCCLERSHELKRAKIINLQYSAHLETCRGGRTSAIRNAASHHVPGAASARGTADIY